MKLSVDKNIVMKHKCIQGQVSACVDKSKNWNKSTYVIVEGREDVKNWTLKIHIIKLW